ncbi:glycosyltransferase family 4 protein [Chelativorans sp. YIM 93263]|uniref:glycosyltransferase family 4 protein n=1 Tax=Chelativorans sp. YIM 93263 TaxID=2906648 RepID=UPI002379A9E9|nr:glycosyltransferase family 4 protein [Chelativorans sp. YIM 93263]
MSATSTPHAPAAVFVANRSYALYNSRLGIMQALVRAGWRVAAACSIDSYADGLKDAGCEVYECSFERGGLAIHSDIAAFRILRRLYRSYKPRLVHHFNAKPVIMGTLAARKELGKSVSVVNTITGLGHAFVTGGPTARLAAAGYRWSLPKADMTIFQNADDHALFLKKAWVREDNSMIIASSGVDLARYPFVDRSARADAAPVVSMIGRLLGQKGVKEFVAVASRVRAEWPDVRFLLAGEADPDHPDSIDLSWVISQVRIEYLGRLADVRPLLEQSDIFLFPSYREGVPRVILEAAAMGLPTIAFDVPGVREAVRNGETGALVPHRDVDAMTERTTALLKSGDKRLEMGREARRLVERSFDIDSIRDRHLALYEDLARPMP